MCKLFYHKIEKYYSKNRIRSGVKRFWVIQNNKSVMGSISDLNSRKKAKQLSNFDFSTLYTKIHHDRLLAILNSVPNCAFRGDTRDKRCLLNNNAFWIKS